MRLTLRSHSSAQRPACAAFLRGTEPAAWLREIGRWGLTPGQLRCFLVPESIHSVRTAGLFVVVSGVELPADVLDPYGVEAGRLYLPVNASLWPATSPTELGAALLWPWQLLHPGIGLVGFDTHDELDLSTLLDCGPPRPTDWGRAVPGTPLRPRLHQIRMLPPTAAEVVQSMQAEIGSQPLQALPGLADAKTSRVQAMVDSIRHGLLWFGLALLRFRPGGPSQSEGSSGKGLLTLVGLAAMLAILTANSSSADWSTRAILGLVLLFMVGGTLALAFLLGGAAGSPPPRHGAGSNVQGRPAAARPGASTGPGLLARLEQWMGNNLQDLERKRQNEIERLLRLFGENLEEALKYAIPLGGPYQDRGTAPPSSRLGTRLAEFSLNALGGGRATDVWNLDSYRHSLHQQYHHAALQEEAAGRFKKAAYIHAHLLGNFRAAAASLERGGFFREAAALHKDHLRNLPAAAECLERGSLLHEAAELYAELGQHEKAGDLLTHLEQPELAARHYERGVEQLLGNDDLPAAARLLADKLAAPARAQELLLRGWDGPKQPEVCLAQYFTLVAAGANTELNRHVQAIYEHRTPPRRRLQLLQVLASLTAQQPADEALMTTSRGIAYAVVSAEASSGNTAPLALLRHFQPHDRLIAADCSRYTSRQPRHQAPDPLSWLKSLQLDASIEWQKATVYRQQWVAVGIRHGQLHLARGNWYGNLEYYSWATPTLVGFVDIVADEQYSSRILLRTPESLTLETKYLPKNKYFSEALTVECPSWLPPWPARLCLLPDNRVASLELPDRIATIHRFEADGRAMLPIHCPLQVDNPSFPGFELDWPGPLLYRNERYFFSCHTWLGWVDEKANSDIYETRQPITRLVCSPYAPRPLLAAGTENGLQLWTPSQASNPSPGPSFLTDCVPHGHLRFVGPEHLVTADGHQAGLFQLDGNGEMHFLRSIEAQGSIIAILPTSKRQQFVLLEASGKLTLHSISDD